MIHKTKALDNRMVRANLEELAITFLKIRFVPTSGWGKKEVIQAFFFLFQKISTMAMSKREGGESRNSVTLRAEPYCLKDLK